MYVYLFIYLFLQLNYHEQIRAVHGDLKPENILVKVSGCGRLQPHLIDLDRSFVLPNGKNQLKKSNHNTHGDIRVDYLSPELVVKLSRKKLEQNIQTYKDVIHQRKLYAFDLPQTESANRKNGMIADEVGLIDTQSMESLIKEGNAVLEENEHTVVNYEKNDLYSIGLVALYTMCPDEERSGKKLFLILII